MCVCVVPVCLKVRGGGYICVPVSSAYDDKGVSCCCRQPSLGASC